jgi:archaemetzincin
VKGSPHVRIVPVGTLDEGVLSAIAERAGPRLPWPVRVGPGLANPDEAWSPERGQHLSTRLLALLEELRPDGAARILGVGDLDLFIPVLTFVFGEARLDGTAAVVGLRRLRPTFYGLPADPALELERAVKETLHEIGHTFSLLHCRRPGCVMNASPSVEAVDLKTDRYCGDCERKLRRTAEYLNTGR